MKNDRLTTKKLALILLCLAISALMLACSGSSESVWADAVHLTDQTFGEGAKTIVIDVVAEDKSVTFTVNTDKETLGEALIEHGIVEGEQGAYGLYIKKVNGISADYDTDLHYWKVSKDGVDLMTGADGETISGGEHYEIVRTK